MAQPPIPEIRYQEGHVECFGKILLDIGMKQGVSYVGRQYSCNNPQNGIR